MSFYCTRLFNCDLTRQSLHKYRVFIILSYQGRHVTSLLKPEANVYSFIIFYFGIYFVKGLIILQSPTPRAFPSTHIQTCVCVKNVDDSSTDMAQNGLTSCESTVGMIME